jgi:hypothetical protein
MESFAGQVVATHDSIGYPKTGSITPPTNRKGRDLSRLS